MYPSFRKHPIALLQPRKRKQDIILLCGWHLQWNVCVQGTDVPIFAQPQQEALKTYLLEFRLRSHLLAPWSCRDLTWWMGCFRGKGELRQKNVDTLTWLGRFTLVKRNAATDEFVFHHFTGAVRTFADLFIALFFERIGLGKWLKNYPPHPVPQPSKSPSVTTFPSLILKSCHPQSLSARHLWHAGNFRFESELQLVLSPSFCPHLER